MRRVGSRGLQWVEAEGRVPSPGACIEDRQFIAAKHPFSKGSVLRANSPGIDGSSREAATERILLDGLLASAPIAPRQHFPLSEQDALNFSALADWNPVTLWNPRLRYCVGPMMGPQNEDNTMNPRMTPMTTLVPLLIALAATHVATAESPSTATSTSQRSPFSKEAQDKIRSVQATLVKYQQRTGNFPSTEIGLLALVAGGEKGDLRFKGSGDALPALPVDPWGRPYVYSTTRNTMTLTSSGPSPDIREDDIVVIETVALPGIPTPVPAQAVPLQRLLRSVEDSDVALFQGCWSETAKAGMGLNDVSAKGMLERYKSGFTRTFGEYKVDEFLFGFIGNAASGWVTVKFKDKEVPPIAVVQSGGEWKLDEE
jgi:hypothetical protein